MVHLDIVVTQVSVEDQDIQGLAGLVYQDILESQVSQEILALVDYPDILGQDQML